MNTKIQTTTHMGIYSMLAGFLNIFQDVKISQFFLVFADLTCGEAITALMPLAIGAWAILHDEESKTIGVIK